MLVWILFESVGVAVPANTVESGLQARNMSRKGNKRKVSSVDFRDLHSAKVYPPDDMILALCKTFVDISVFGDCCLSFWT